VNKCTSRG